MAEQYFPAESASKDVRHTLNVALRSREATAQMSNGMFFGSCVDLGMSILLKHAPEPLLTGDLPDLGCGWGPVALTLALELLEANVWAVDANECAMDLTHANAQANGHTNIHTVRVDKPSIPLSAENQPVLRETVPSDLIFDVIRSSPSIRAGKEALRTLLMARLPKLKVGGAAYLVVQKSLGSGSLILWLDDALGEGFTVSKYAGSKGFRIIEARHKI